MLLNLDLSHIFLIRFWLGAFGRDVTEMMAYPSHASYREAHDVTFLVMLTLVI